MFFSLRLSSRGRRASPTPLATSPTKLQAHGVNMLLHVKEGGNLVHKRAGIVLLTHSSKVLHIGVVKPVDGCGV